MAKYRFEQIAINSTEKKKPVEEDRFTYLGLEHLDSGSLKVTRFGSEVAPIGEKLVMHKGDVLFGKRRAYQKKVAIAPFDGIFSAHGMVLRPREDVIDKISIAGTIGQVGAIPDSIDGANLTENAAKIVLNEGAPVDRDYLIWYLSLPAGAEQIEEKTMHTTQPKLALYRIEEIEVLVPPIAEQRSFAAFVQQSDKSKLLISRLKEFILMGYRGHGKM